VNETPLGDYQNQMQIVPITPVGGRCRLGKIDRRATDGKLSQGGFEPRVQEAFLSDLTGNVLLYLTPRVLTDGTESDLPAETAPTGRRFPQIILQPSLGPLRQQHGRDVWQGAERQLQFFL
jgi:hypothetical protein